MEKNEVVTGDSGVPVADVSRLPWWRRPPLPAIVAVVLVVGIVYWLASDDALEFSDLELLPKDSSFVLVVNVAEVYTSDLGEAIREAFSDQIRKLEGEMRKEAAFVPEDLSHFVVGGNPGTGEPVMILAFKDEPDDEQLAKLVKSVRVKESEPTEVDGYRVWGSKSKRTAVLEIREGTYLIGPRVAVDHALAVLDSGGSSELADLMSDHDLLDAPIAAVFDWRSIRDIRREFPRGLDGVVTAMEKHIGPIVARAEVDDGVVVEWKLLDSDDDIMIRSTTEIDGDFLEELIRDLARLVPQR